MAHRQFKDNDGVVWSIRDPTTSEWEFVPVEGGRSVRVPSPGYEKDPFDVSNEELQRLLDAHRPGGGGAEGAQRQKKNPFID